MLRDRSNITGAANYFSKEKIYMSLLQFIESHLPGFPAYLKSVDSLLTKENDITQQLFFYLDDKTRTKKTDFIPFRFCNQFGYPNVAYSSDIGVLVEMFSRRDAFFVIEAKRLPTPGSDRKKEYVSGKKGGLERFKRNLHGKNLPMSAIVAYVTKNDFGYWETEVNSWIKELFSNNTEPSLIWLPNDLLTFQYSFNDVNKYSSLNKRIEADDISLFHYWINLS